MPTRNPEGEMQPILEQMSRKRQNLQGKGEAVRPEKVFGVSSKKKIEKETKDIGSPWEKGTLVVSMVFHDGPYRWKVRFSLEKTPLK